MAENALSGQLSFLTIGSSRFAIRQWGNPQGLPVLALHGWLDNCASFEFLAPLLTGCHVVCVDLAGHGQSSDRPGNQGYSLWYDVTDVFALADALQWQQFSLLGHSRGAMIALIAAGTIPARVEHLMLLEGVIPFITSASQAPARLGRAIETLAAVQARPARFYRSFERAVETRVKGAFPVSYADARALACHGVKKDECGYYWRYDVKLSATSEVGFTQAQVDAFAERVVAQTCLLLAEEGTLIKNTELATWLEERPWITREVFPGGHHFHMSEQCDALAKCILTVLNRNFD